MRLFFFLLLVTLSQLSFSAVCESEPLVTSDDSYEYSANVFIVCPRLIELTDEEALALVKSYIEKYSGTANEIFYIFLRKDNHLKETKELSLDVPESEIIGDYYDGTGRFYIMKGPDNKRYIQVHKGHTH